MSEKSGTIGVRERMIAGGGTLFTRQGYAATTMRGIVAEAGTPWGSVHHYFPGGKEEVALAAIDLGDRDIRSTINACLKASSSVGEAVHSYFVIAGAALADSDFELGCPVATVALEQASMDTAITSASRTAMSSWVGMWAEALITAGVRPERADEIGTVIVLNVEGALLLSRIARSLQPLQLASEVVAAVIDNESSLSRQDGN